MGAVQQLCMPMGVRCLLIVLLGCGGGSAAFAPVAAQVAGTTRYVVLRGGTPIGTMEVSLSRDQLGWRVQSTGDATGAPAVAVRQFDARYDRGWQGRALTVERLTRGAATVVHVAGGTGTAHTDIGTKSEARWRSHSVSPDVVFLPDHAYGAFAAVAARLHAAGQRAEIPLLFPPDGEQRAVVDAWERMTVRTRRGGPLTVNRHTLTIVGPSPWQVHVWEAAGQLVRVDLPRDQLSVVRSDVLP